MAAPALAIAKDLQGLKGIALSNEFVARSLVTRRACTFDVLLLNECAIRATSAIC